MLHARIDGNATTTVSHPSLDGQVIVLCTPIDENGKKTGAPFAALDPYNSGLHSHVMITTDGSFTSNRIGDRNCPIRNEVVGIIDQ